MEYLRFLLFSGIFAVTIWNIIHDIHCKYKLKSISNTIYWNFISII